MSIDISYRENMNAVSDELSFKVTPPHGDGLGTPAEDI